MAGSHLVHQRLFHERGTGRPHDDGRSHHDARRSADLGPPVPVLGRRGDLLLAHFLLGHNTGGNLTTTTRRMLYYRLGCPAHAEAGSATFLDPLTEYEPVRRAMMSA